MILEIPLQAKIFNYQFVIELDEEIFTLEFKFNDRSLVWSMNIFDVNGNPVIMGICLLTDVDFYSKYKMETRPKGLLIVFDKDKLGRNGDFTTMGQSVKMNYLEAADLAAL